MPSKKYNVSVKAVLLIEGKIVLLKNERDEWELPGGKLDDGEQPQDCVIREIYEELSIEAVFLRMLDSWVYTIFKGVEVLILTYAYQSNAKISDVIYSSEHKELGFFGLKEITGLNMPQGYKDSISRYTEVV